METQDSRCNIVTADVIDELYGEGVLDAKAQAESLAFLRRKVEWRSWLDRISLILGAALLLSGIIFFFAFNWSRISGLMKLGIIELPLLGLILVVWKTGVQKLGGRMLLLSASTLVGVFLAVFGQTYQTGADAWQLFSLWSLLIIPWVFLSRFPGLYLLWIVLINIAVILHHQQTRESIDGLPTWLYLLLALLIFFFLAGREFLDARGIDWVSQLWPRRLLLSALLFYLVVPTIALIMTERSVRLEDVLATVLFTIFVYGAAIYFWRRVQDLSALALLVLSCDIVLLFLLGRVILEFSHDSGMILLLALAVMTVFTLSGRWLVKIRNAMQEGEYGQD